MLSLKGNPGSEEKKNQPLVKKSNNQIKQNMESKDKEPTDMESLHCIIKRFPMK